MMRPPPLGRRKPLRRAASGLPKNGSLSERAGDKNSTKPYVVVVDSPNRTVQWGAFADLALAERTKAQLARWGFVARIVERDEVQR
jgi:cell division protein FtsN